MRATLTTQRVTENGSLTVIQIETDGPRASRNVWWIPGTIEPGTSDEEFMALMDELSGPVRTNQGRLNGENT